MQKPRLKFLGIVLSGLLVTGCGGDSEQLFVSPPPGQTSAMPYLPGRVAIGRIIGGGEVLFANSQGQTLGRTSLAPDGTFGVDPSLSGAVWVTARLSDVAAQGQVWQLSALLESFDRNGKEIVLNIPTTLVGRFQQRHPELSLAECQSRVQQFLGIPKERALQTLDESAGSPFAHELFFSEAAANGGVEAFLTSLLDEMEANGTHTFQLDGVFKAGTSFLGGCVKALAVDFTKSEAVTGAGWASRAMGVNFPFPSNNDLAERIQSIQDQVSDLAKQLKQFEAETAYQDAVGKLGADVVVPSNSLATSLQSTVQTFVPLQPDSAYLQPGSSYSSLSALENLYSKNNTKAMLDELVSYLEGTRSQGGVSQRMERLLVALAFPGLGIDSDLSRYNGYGAFSNTTVGIPRSMLAYYLTVFEQTVLMFAEQSHNTNDAATLVINIREGQPYLSRLAQARQRILAQTPEALGSDDLFVDREAGLIWWMGNLGSHGSQVPYTSTDKKVGAVEYSGRFQGPGGVWRVPTAAELQKLYGRIVAGSKAQPVPGGKLAKVLSRWGWDISYMTDDHQVWVAIPNLAQSEQRFSLDTGKIEKVSAGRYNDLILVSSFDATAITDTSIYPPLSVGTVTAIEISQQPQGPAGVQLKAQATVSYTIGGSYTVGGASQSAPQETVATKTLDVTDQVVWSSSNEAMLIVTNIDATTDTDGNILSQASHGLASWQPFNSQTLTPVTVSASFNGVSSAVTLTPPASLSPNLVSLQVLPANVDLSNTFPIQFSFQAVLFYSDPITGDAQAQHFAEQSAPSLVWTLLDNSGAPIPPSQGSGFISSDANNLVLSTPATNPFMIVQAAANGATGVKGTTPIKASPSSAKTN